MLLGSGRAGGRRSRVAIASSTVAALVLASAAFAATPASGTFSGKASQTFVKASDNTESFTVAKTHASITKWNFHTTGTCNSGNREDLFDNNGGEKAIPIKNGAFNTTHTVTGSINGENGTLTIHYKGQFTNAHTAPTTVTINFTQGGAGQPVGGSCTSKATFTAHWS